MIDFGLAANRIRDIPVLDFFGMIVEGVAALSAEIDDHVGVIPSVARDGLGGKAFKGVAVVLEGLLRGRRDIAKGEKACARGFDDVGGFAESDGFGHGAATGVADADEEDTECWGQGHIEIVARIFSDRVGRGSTRQKRKKKDGNTEITEGRTQRPQR